MATDGDSVVSEESEDIVRPPVAEVAIVVAASARADREVGVEVIGTADRISWAERAEVAGAAVTPFSMPRDFTGVPPVDDARAPVAEFAIVVAAPAAPVARRMLRLGAARIGWRDWPRMLAAQA
jgi:hypothetical protein